MSFVLIWKWMTFHCTEHDRSVCPWWITVIERGITIFSGREGKNDNKMIITNRSITNPISGCPQFVCSNNHLKVLELSEYHRRLYILYSRLVSLSAVVQPTTAPLVLDSPHPQMQCSQLLFYIFWFPGRFVVKIEKHKNRENEQKHSQSFIEVWMGSVPKWHFSFSLKAQCCPVIVSQYSLFGSIEKEN